MMANDELARTLERLLAEARAGRQPQPEAARLSEAGWRPEARVLAEIRAWTGQTGGAATPDSGRSAPVVREVANPAGAEVAESADRLGRQLAELTAAARVQAAMTETNTRALIENSLAQAEGSKRSTAASIGKSLFSFLGSGLGLVKLFGGLFGGHEEKVLPALPRYVAPPPVVVEAGYRAEAGGAVQQIRYAQDGLPRPVSSTTLPPAPQVTVQVQAMDSRSFLDHSSEIAQAVKEALLASHSLNDVVAEL